MLRSPSPAFLHSLSNKRVHRQVAWAFSSIIPSRFQRRLSNSPQACAQPPTTHPAVQTRLFLPTAAHTYRLGALLAYDICGGDVILLCGSLGAGKTSLARGYVQTAHKDPQLDVTSPTYLLVNSYPGNKEHGVPTVLHMDLWRVENATTRPIVDFDRAFQECVSLIEWPDRLGSLIPEERLEVNLEYPPRKEMDDDPWGFGSGELDEGRYAQLVPFGLHWTQRVEEMLSGKYGKDEEGRTVLFEG